MRLKLLEPGQIGKMTLKNRVVMCPMGNLLNAPDGSLIKRRRDYYVERAKGGVGLIITGVSTTISDGLEPGPNRTDSLLLSLLILKLNPIHDIFGLKELADAVHQYGAKLCAQLSVGIGRVAWSVELQPVSASAVPAFFYPDVTCRALTQDEIKILVEAFGNTAAFAKAAGADAVEIHGYGGYLLDQFQSALWNKRTDEYGGDLDSRLRLSMELIQAVQKSCGINFPIIYKFTPKHYIEGGRELEEGLEMAQRLQSAGVAALHVDMGCYEAWYRAIPPVYLPDACQIELSEAVKKVVNIPVIAQGKLGRPEVGERVLQEEKVDFVALGRPLLADPNWVNKVREGRVDDIRPCIGCLEGCINRVFMKKPISCAVNPACGNESEYQLTPTPKPKTVLVIGGGAAGMEAALVAASRGHHVTLWERSSELGGSLLAASAPKFKKDLEGLVGYFRGQMKKLGVRVELMKEGTPDNVLHMAPNVVIVAAGGEPIIPDIPGIRKGNVFTAIDVLRGRKSTGQRVVVVGGGLVGCELAVFLAEQGKQVTIVEMMDRLLPEPMFLINQTMLLKMVKDSAIEVMIGAKLEEIDNTGMIVKQDRVRKSVACDSVVLALGFKGCASLKEELEGKVLELFMIGDCVEPRRVINAVWEGFDIARSI